MKVISPKQQYTYRVNSHWHKLPQRYGAVVFAFFMATIMAGLMCMVITAANSGVSGHYFAKVLHAYVLAMPVAFMCVLVVRPIVLKLVSWTVKNSG